MKNQLPDAFVEFLTRCLRSRRFKSCTRFHRGLITRLNLWRDGHPQNAIPGYDNPPPDGPKGYPLGWSVASIREIARECNADIESSIRRGFAKQATKTLGLRYTR